MHELECLCVRGGESVGDVWIRIKLLYLIRLCLASYSRTMVLFDSGTL